MSAADSSDGEFGAEPVDIPVPGFSGAVVGSGIMGDRLAGGNVAIALLANTIATGAMLVAFP